MAGKSAMNLDYFVGKLVFVQLKGARISVDTDAREGLAPILAEQDGHVTVANFPYVVGELRRHDGGYYVRYDNKQGRFFDVMIHEDIIACVTSHFDKEAPKLSIVS